MRRPAVVLSLAGITALALVVSVLLILFSVNPTTQSNQDEIRSQQIALERQVREINEIICSQAQTTANAYRFRSLTPSGEVEPIRHFLTRMQAQRQTLRLSRGRDCPVAPGFPPFEIQLKRALNEINAILNHFSPELRKPVNRGVSQPTPTPNPFQVSPKFGIPGFSNPDMSGHAGVGEEGVPAPPDKQRTPRQPPAPKIPEASPVEREPRSEPPRLVEGPPPSQSQESPQTSAEPSLGANVDKAVEVAEETLCTAIREVHKLC